ncbi:MAG: hypothetical protein ACK526_15385 [Planctomyces sp.]
MSKISRCLLVSGLPLTLCGCFHNPGGSGYMGQPYPYQQPMYSAPGYSAPGSFAAPGTMVVPPSNDPLYNPAPSGSGSGKTFDYNDNPPAGNSDRKNTDTPFYPDKEDPVPTPRDPGAGDSGIFNEDLPRDN